MKTGGISVYRDLEHKQSNTLKLTSAVASFRLYEQKYDFVRLMLFFQIFTVQSKATYLCSQNKKYDFEII